MKLTALTVSNFRSLGDEVRIELNQLTALVGPNGSGKSNVVDALRFVADAMHMGLGGAISHRHGIDAVRRWSGGHPFNMSLQLNLELDTGPATYGFELTGSKDEDYRVKREHLQCVTGAGSTGFEVERGRWLNGAEGLRPALDEQSLALPLIAGDERFLPVHAALKNISVYSIFPDTLRVPQKYSPIKPMSRHGDNWVSVLRDQPPETWKPELVAMLHRLTGDIVDIKISPAASYLLVQFRHHSTHRKAKWFDAAQESDGTLRVAGIVTALCQEPPVPIIGIEEPELTVHPGAVEMLYDHLKQASRRSQVILTTHSPELLRLLEPADIRVVGRQDGVTTVRRMAREQREVVERGLLHLGEVMLMEGFQQDLPLNDSDVP